MAVPDPQLRYATDVFDANGVTTDWEISFTGGYINPSHVYAMSVILDEETQLPTDRTPHTVEVLAEGENSSTVRVQPAVAAGRKLYIYRSTPVHKMLVDYVNGSIISKTNLNLSNDQLLKIIQEMFDSLNIATLSIGQQVGTVIDISKIISEIYKTVIELLESGGIISVEPKVWEFEQLGDGDETDWFAIPEADVLTNSMYDVYWELTPGEGDYHGLVPDTDYHVEIDEEDPELSGLVIHGPYKEAGTRGFAVLRGYAQPNNGPKPLTTTALRTVTITEDTVIDRTYHNAYIIVDSPEDVTLTVRADAGNTLLDWQRGEFCVIYCKGDGVVFLDAEDGATLVPPADYQLRSRAKGETIGVTVGGPNEFIASGGLLRVVTVAVPQTIQFAASGQTGDVAVDDGEVLHLATGFIVDELIGSLSVPQASGSTLTIDLLRNGISILSVPITIDNTRELSTLSTVQPVFVGGGDILFKGDRLEAKVTQAGSGARGLKIALVGRIA